MPKMTKTELESELNLALSRERELKVSLGEAKEESQLAEAELGKRLNESEAREVALGLRLNEMHKAFQVADGKLAVLEKLDAAAKEETSDLKKDLERGWGKLFKLHRFLGGVEPLFTEKKLKLVYFFLKHLVADEITLDNFVDEHAEELADALCASSFSVYPPFQPTQEEPLFIRRETPEFEKFDVKLIDLGSNKIKVTKLIREHTGVSLLEARNLADSPPGTVIAHLPISESSSLCKALEEVGAEAKFDIYYKDSK